MEKEAKEQSFDEFMTENRIANWSVGAASVCALCAGIFAKNFFVGLAVFTGLLTIDCSVALATKRIIKAIEKK